MSVSNYGDYRIPVRFWIKVVPEPNSGCWLWVGSTNKGYGRVLGFAGKLVYAHRLTYGTLIGEPPLWAELDHKCRVTECCNPDHLEPVTHIENVRRGRVLMTAGKYNMSKTACLSGHEYTIENTYTRRNGNRDCRECNRLRGERRYVKV